MDLLQLRLCPLLLLGYVVVILLHLEELICERVHSLLIRLSIKVARLVQSDQFLDGTGQRGIYLFDFAIQMTQLQSVFLDVLFQVDELVLEDTPILLLLLQQGVIPHLLVPQSCLLPYRQIEW